MCLIFECSASEHPWGQATSVHVYRIPLRPMLHQLHHSRGLLLLPGKPDMGINPWITSRCSQSEVSLGQELLHRMWCLMALLKPQESYASVIMHYESIESIPEHCNSVLIKHLMHVGLTRQRCYTVINMYSRCSIYWSYIRSNESYSIQCIMVIFNRLQLRRKCC